MVALLYSKKRIGFWNIMLTFVYKFIAIMGQFCEIKGGRELKKIIVVLLSVIIVIFVFSMFLPNHFSDIIKAEYQKYDSVEEEYGEKIIIEDKDIINRLTKALNDAKHEDMVYDLASAHDIKATLNYEDGKTEVIYIWLDFGPDSTMFKVDNRDGTYKLKNNKARDELFQIFSFSDT